MASHKLISKLCGFSMLLLPSGLGQDRLPPKAHSLHVESLMSAAEFRSCGLTKLSKEEIAHLDAGLESFSARMAGVGENKANDRRGSEVAKDIRTPDVIEGEIEGEFHGWDGETVFKLTNGQIWQQAEYDYDYEYDYQPNVLIYKTEGGYKMKVEGVEETIYVKRIK